MALTLAALSAVQPVALRITVYLRQVFIPLSGGLQRELRQTRTQRGLAVDSQSRKIPGDVDFVRARSTYG
jgi:hypothetical protein